MPKHLVKWIDSYPIDNKTIVTSLLESMDWNEPLIRDLNDRLVAINRSLNNYFPLIIDGEFRHLLSDEEINRLTEEYRKMAINTDFTGEPMIITPGNLTEAQLWDMYTQLYPLHELEGMVNDIMAYRTIDQGLWDAYVNTGLHPYLDLEALSDDIIDSIRTYYAEN